MAQLHAGIQYTGDNGIVYIYNGEKWVSHSSKIPMRKLNYNSIYREFSKKTVEWISGDTPEMYESNILTRKLELEKYGWVNTKFDYTFNSVGFRCEEFSEDPTVVFLGCSYTIGVGMPAEQTWSSLVAKSLNLKSANLGQGGGSNDTAFRLGYHWIPKIKPKLVVFLTPPDHRFEIVSSGMIHLITPHHHADQFVDFMGEWCADKTNTYHNYLKNLLAIENICTTNQIKFISYNCNDFRRIDLARDLAHPGVISNQQLAEEILKLV
jgi:hypothetical protein